MDLEDRVLLAHDLNLLALNGLAINPTPGVAPYDWSDIYFDFQNPGANTSGTAGAFTFLRDPINTNDDIFTGGQSKDINNLDAWQWKLGSVQDKDDIQNAFAAMYHYTGAPIGNTDTGDHIF